MVTKEELAFYSSPGEMTQLDPIGDVAPADVAKLCAMVQGIVMHPFWTKSYGFDAPPERQEELQIRPAADILAKALELDPSPLTEVRPPDRRVLGNCRDFSTVTTALLRRHGVPARARCGFGAYFVPNLYIDHWIIEWWNGERWQRTDAQLDQVQQKALNLDFDPLDMPSGRFLDGGTAWQLYRRGEAKPDQFGVLDMFGVEFLRGNLARDLASLNKVEMLPWDGWDFEMSADEATLDAAAEISAAADFEAVRELYASDARLRVPDVILAYVPEPHEVRIR